MVRAQRRSRRCAARRMLPRPRPPQNPGLSTGSDRGAPRSPGQGVFREPAPPPDSRRPRARPRPRAPSAAGSRAEPQPPTERTPETPAPLSTQEKVPCTMTPLPPWDPNYVPKATTQPISCGSGAAFSSRTLCHPSWPMYDACGRASTPGEQRTSQDAGLPVMGREDVFLLDPLMPCGQRIPLYVSEPPHQAVGSMKLKLLLPPPIMSTRVQPAPRPDHSCAPAPPPDHSCAAWLTESEISAVSGLLQMSQGEPGSNSLADPPTSTSSTDPISDHLGPSNGQSFSEGTDPSPTQSPDSH